MTTLALNTNTNTSRRTSLVVYSIVGLAVLLVLAAIATPNLLRSRIAADEAARVGRQRAQMSEFMSTDAASSKSVAEAPSQSATAPPDRKIIRKAAMEVIVDSPRAGIDRAMQIVQQYGGYVVASNLGGTSERQTGTITLRVPFEKFDAVRNELRGIAKSVDSEQVSSDDVTMQYAENEATLRNYRAEEASYLDIMKRSGKISDTLEVARQLADVRGRIERLQAQIKTMEHETAMASIAMDLRTEPVVAKKGWRPLYQLQNAWNEGLDSLATFATFIIALLLQLPAVFAWLVTIAVGGKLAFVLFRWAAMALGFWKPVSALPAPNQQ